MLNQNILKINVTDGILGDNLPMQKSMVISDNVLFWDLDNSTSTIKVTNRRNTQALESRKSMVVTSGIIYPGSSFLAKKLKRILQSHLSKAFSKIKDYRRQIINLSLVSQKFRRTLESGFFEILLYYHLHKGSQLQSVISRNKRPHLMYQLVAKAVKKTQNNAMQKLIKLNKRKKNVIEFTRKFEISIKSSIVSYMKKIFIRNLKQNWCKSTDKVQGAEGIWRLIPKIIKRMKLQTLRSIIWSTKVQQIQEANLMKKQVACKMNETQAERARTMNSEREKIRNIKNDLDFYSADRSKAKYEIRKDINLQRSKLREEEKKARVSISCLNQQIQQIAAELASINHLNQSRLKKIAGQVDAEKVKGLFIELQKLEENKVGEVCPLWEKQVWRNFSQRANSLDEFHVYVNQKLRQLLMEYQNATPKTHEAEKIIVEQNVNLKEMMQCIIRRSLQNAVSKQKLKQLYD